MEIYLPLAGVTIPWPLLVLLGLLVGTLQGFFGVGGGWLTTPALNILGFPIVYAIGTDLSYTFATGMVGSWRHHRLGNLDTRLASVLGLTGMAGMEAARRLVFFLDERGLAESAVRGTYILLLLGVGLGVLLGSVRGRGRGPTESQASSTTEPASSLSRYIRALSAPPLVRASGGSISVSFWALAAMGGLVGLLAGFLGTGGGFVMVPMLIYLVGLPTREAVAASLFSIALTNGFGTLTYGLAGRVELLAAALMFAGSIVGAQLGATATVYVRGQSLQVLLGVTLMAAGVAVALRQLELSAASAVVMFLTASAMTGVILTLLARAQRQERGARPIGGS